MVVDVARADQSPLPPVFPGYCFFFGPWAARDAAWATRTVWKLIEVRPGAMRKQSEAGVRFAACQNTMRRRNISKEDLLPFVGTVDSGVAEVVRKQEEGWAYLKGGS